MSTCPIQRDLSTEAIGCSNVHPFMTSPSSTINFCSFLATRDWTLYNQVTQEYSEIWSVQFCLKLSHRTQSHCQYSNKNAPAGDLVLEAAVKVLQALQIGFMCHLVRSCRLPSDPQNARSSRGGLCKGLGEVHGEAHGLGMLLRRLSQQLLQEVHTLAQ